MLCDPSSDGSCVPTANLGQYLPLAVPDTTTFSVSTPMRRNLTPKHSRCRLLCDRPGADMETDAFRSAADTGAGICPASDTGECELEKRGEPLYNTDCLTTATGYKTEVPIYCLTAHQAIGSDQAPLAGAGYRRQEGSAGAGSFSTTSCRREPTATILSPRTPPSWAPAPAPITITNPIMPAMSLTTCAIHSVPSIPSSTECFQDNRATLHLHGGITPWISDGTPHQWISPATVKLATNNYTQGQSVGNVPDMAGVYHTNA